VPTGTRAGKERKRRTVAVGVIAGQDTAEIAAAAGCQPRYVQRLANDPETQFLITEALAPHREKLQRMAARAVYSVNMALLAKRTDKADHMARLRAVERYGELLGLAQGGKPQDAAADGAMVTWEQFTLMYEKRTVTAI
jgi:hypothetical protein